MDEFEARFESLRAQFKDYGSLYDENFEGRFTREDCREVLAMVDNLPADDVASKPGFKAQPNCTQGVSSLANRAFEPLFERQAQAEKIRF
ncbi:putative Exocyst complex component [Corchorus olitorius]|uniref:Exocyst complex component n=1 Tax=Corchorus olitorius TaxID=93759 RepID=A0A1R3GD46_9ROSI|nr:putative Exocyst complex component [Corchorus olitorius]